MTDPTSIWDHCIYGLDVSFFFFHRYEIFLNAIEEVSKNNMNHFDCKKYACCSICDNKGHAFDACPQLSSPDLKDSYIRLCILVNRFDLV